MRRALRKRFATGIAAVRHKLGYTQAELAQILIISRSALAMAERFRRSLPSKALGKLINLELERLQKEAAAKEQEILLADEEAGGYNSCYKS